MQGFPFDSQLTFDSDNLPVYDRAVSSQPLRKLIRDLFTTGVMPNPSTNLQVSSGLDGMTVQVQAGFAVIDGGLCQETETRTLEVTAADTTYDRIDTVVVRWNENVDVRTADLYVVAGTPSATPVRPALQRDNSIYEIGLADIFVTKRVATITGDKITDTRYEAERCGIVSSVSEWDTTTIYQQIQADLAGFKADEQAEFITWFNKMKGQLSEDAAGHLEQSKANLDGGNTFTGGNQTVQGKNINLQSTNITRGATIESNTWGDSRLNIVDSNRNRCAYIQPLQRATGEIDLHIEKDSNNTGGRILINGIDIEQINQNLTANNTTAGVTDIPFRFGCDDSGNFGYILNEGGADTVHPFKNIHYLGNFGTGNYLNGGAKYANIDIKNLLPDMYNKLTVDNFIIEPNGLHYYSYDVGARENAWDWGLGSKSYNQSTGILSVLTGGGNLYPNVWRKEAWINALKVYAVY